MFVFLCPLQEVLKTNIMELIGAMDKCSLHGRKNFSVTSKARNWKQYQKVRSGVVDCVLAQ